MCNVSQDNLLIICRLSGNKLSDDETVYLAAALHQNQSLQILKLVVAISLIQDVINSNYGFRSGSLLLWLLKETKLNCSQPLSYNHS